MATFSCPRSRQRLRLRGQSPRMQQGTLELWSGLLRNRKQDAFNNSCLLSRRRLGATSNSSFLPSRRLGAAGLLRNRNQDAFNNSCLLSRRRLGATSNSSFLPSRRLGAAPTSHFVTRAETERRRRNSNRRHEMQRAPSHCPSDAARPFALPLGMELLLYCCFGIVILDRGDADNDDAGGGGCDGDGDGDGDGDSQDTPLCNAYASYPFRFCCTS